MISPEEWTYIESLPTKTQRRERCRFLLQKHNYKQETLRKEAERKAAAIEKRKEIIGKKQNCEHLYYGLGGNTLFRRIGNQAFRKLNKIKLARARLRSPKLIIDCAFEEEMSRKQSESAGRQMFTSFISNRGKKTPFDLQFYNVKLDGIPFKCFEKNMPTIRQLPVIIRSHCFTEDYPRHRLVYLSPDSDNTLEELNADDVYIIGCIVDTGPCKPFSLTKAKEMGIRHAKLPIDNYIKMNSGHGKRFTINSVVDILNIWRQTKDWIKAFERIPERKIAEVKRNREQTPVPIENGNF